MPPERPIRKELASTPRSNAERSDKSRTAIEAFALGVGAASAAILNASHAEAGDAAFVGRNQYLDRVDLNTGVVTSSTPFGSSQAVLYGAQVIEPSSGDSYIVLSVRDTVNGDKLIKATDLDAATPVLDILPEPVSVPKEIHVNTGEGIFSLASGGTAEAIACTIDNSEICARYSIDVSLSLGIIFDNTDGPTPTLISVNDMDGTVRLYPLTPDANGDGFPEPSATGEVPSDIESLGSTSAPMAFHFNDATKVLTVGTLNDKQIHAMDLDTASATPSILTRYDTSFVNLRPVDIVDTGTGDLVVLGHNLGSTGYRASFTMGLDASTLTPNIPESSFGSNSRVGAYQAGGMDSDVNLVVLHSNWGQVRTYDLSFNQIDGPFSTGGSGFDEVIVVYQAPAPPADPLDTDDDGDGLSENQGDCDDTDATVWEESEFWVDADGDLVGDDTTPSDWFCGAGEAALYGYTANTPGDCDDTSATVYPGAPEQCNGVSDDCDPEVDEDLTFLTYYDDSGDGDGFGDPATLTVACSIPASPGLWIFQGEDCSPANAAINPAAPEVCGNGSEDCDAQIDEPNAQGSIPQFPDADGDTLGAVGSQTTNMCPGTLNWAPIDSDCDDNDGSVHPGAPEYADGRDKDCDTNLSAALGVEITASTDNTLIGNPGNPSENGPNILKGLGQSVNVKVTQMAREFDEILDETQEVLGYQTVDSSAVGQLRVSREAGGVPVIVYELPGDAAPDYIPTWTAAVTGTVLEVLDQPSGIVHLSVIEGTSVVIETEFYNDSDLWDAYEEANPEAGGNPLTLSGPNEWVEIDKATGEIVDSNVTMIEAFLDFVEEYQQGDDDSAPDDDDETPDDDDTEDDDDGTPDDDDVIDDDTTEEVLDDDSGTHGDDDSALEEPGCQESGCSMTIQNLDSGTNVKADISPMFTMTALLLTLAARVRRGRKTKEWAGRS